MDRWILAESRPKQKTEERIVGRRSAGSPTAPHVLSRLPPVHHTTGTVSSSLSGWGTYPGYQRRLEGPHVSVTPTPSHRACPSASPLSRPLQFFFLFASHAILPAAQHPGPRGWTEAGSRKLVCATSPVLCPTGYNLAVCASRWGGSRGGGAAANGRIPRDGRSVPGGLSAYGGGLICERVDLASWHRDTLK